MKESWIAPKTGVQRFMANEYVAACGVNTKGEYLFTCDAPAGYMYRKSGSGYKLVSYSKYHPCGSTHTTPTLDGYVEGYIDYNDNGKYDSGEEVMLWLEYNSWGSVVDGHATTNVDYTTWTEPEVRS